jgi:hypothetical protein
MQHCKTLRQPLLGELAMSPEERGGEKNAIYSDHLRLCQQPRAETHSARTNTILVIVIVTGNNRLEIRYLHIIVTISYFVLLCGMVCSGRNRHQKLCDWEHFSQKYGSSLA